MTLPSIRAVVPAGALGAVVLELNPSIKLDVTGKLDVRTSVTLRCGAEYRYDNGASYRTSYCRTTNEPLQLSSDSGVDATLTGTLGAKITLDDVAGITGSLTAAVHAGFHPTKHPVGEIDASANYDLNACLACFWSGSPATVQIAHGDILRDRVLARYDTVPPVPDTPVIITTNLPSGTVGVPYSTDLTTEDHRQGHWSVTSGSLPAGLNLLGYTISGKPTASGQRIFTVTFTDTAGRTASATLTIQIAPGTGATTSGAVQNLDYCTQNVFDRNDDATTSTVSLPFTVNFGGTSYTSLYISNNGYVTFGSDSGSYTPSTISPDRLPVIAPFYADVDTRSLTSSLVTYGVSGDGRSLCVNWVDVGYFNQHADKRNSIQLILTSRSDQGLGDFDVTFNYGAIKWETGDASSGSDGFGGVSARVGFDAATGGPGSSYQLVGSGVNGALLDGGPNALTSGSRQSAVIGRYVFPFRAGGIAG